MTLSRASLLPVFSLLTFVATAAHAADPTTSDCLNANEKAISLRNENKLRAARAELLVCAAANCPADIRTECTRRVEEVNASMPTIVFEVEDGSGNHLSAVKLTMDGALLAERLEGTALSIDPGVHVFQFETAGQPLLEKKLVIFEGGKDRRERIVLGVRSTVEPATPGAAAPPPAAIGDAAGRGSGGGGRGDTQRLLGWTAVGAGTLGLGVGLVFTLVKNGKVSDRDDICPTDLCTDAEDLRIERLTEEARSANTVSAISFIAGGVFVAGGLALVFTAPTGSGSVAVAPALAPGFHGVAVTGSMF